MTGPPNGEGDGGCPPEAEAGADPGSRSDTDRGGIAPGAAAPEAAAGEVPSPALAAAALRELAELVEAEIPAGYRSEAFRALASWRLGARAPGEAPRAPQDASPSHGLPADSVAALAPQRQAAAGVRPGRLDLSPFATILGGSGRMLQKALVALEVSRGQLGVDWLTPTEIERFLIERARVRTAYRTNISNALSGARHLADRRRRGRGYEYRITPPGRDLLERELRLGAER